MPQPVTLIENIYVKISWDYPVDNSDTVTTYDVQILQSDGQTFSADLQDCDGSNPAIIQKLYCFVPMTVLRASPFTLQFEDYVTVKVRAMNTIGWGPYSQLSSLST